MFNRDGLFQKKDENVNTRTPSKDQKPVNLTPGLNPTPPRPATPEPTAKADTQKPEPLVDTAQPLPAITTEESRGSRLIVGPDIKLKGVEITDCDTLVVEGRVEASMDSRVIQIAEAGVFAGTVGIDIAEIRGRFEGELTARKQLVVRATGRVSGKIRYGKLMVEEGGEVNGDVSTIAAAPRQVEPANADNIGYDSYSRKAKTGS